MNFVRLYIGDYLRDTGTLTVAEHGAYLLMLLHHYATEQPLPQGRELHRLLRAEGKHERDAVDAMAARFWTATPDGLVNDRAGKEIARADHQRSVNQETGKRGGRPKRTETESVSEQETESVSESKANDNPNQTPDTRQVSDGAKAPSSSAAPTGRTARQQKTPEIPPPYDAIVEAYHEALPSLPRVRLRNGPTWDERKKAIAKFWRWVLTSNRSDGTRRATSGDEGLAWFRGYFARAHENDFIMGRTGRGQGHEGWVADFDFLLTKRGMKQVIEKTKDAA